MKAYFIYYGTKDTRSAQVLGPFIWGKTGVPAPRTEYVTDLKPGAKRYLGSAVPGMKAAWFRIVQKDTAAAPVTESFYSTYQARPLFYQVGIAAPAATTEVLSTDPEPGVIPETNVVIS